MKRNKLLIWKLVASGFGLGYSSIAPGTMGALGALVPAILILKFAPAANYWLLSLVLIFTILGVIGANKLRYLWGKDPSKIVVDEMVGMWISLLWVGSNWATIVAAFILFRFFDIVKPFGIRRSEQLSGGQGVMVDDILAGIYTNLILQISMLIIPVVI